MAAEKIFCTSCGAVNIAEASFCTTCGSPITIPGIPATPETTVVTHPDLSGDEIHCTNCGAKNIAVASFCTTCGAAIQDSVPPVAEMPPPAEPEVEVVPPAAPEDSGGPESEQAAEPETPVEETEVASAAEAPAEVGLAEPPLPTWDAPAGKPLTKKKSKALVWVLVGGGIIALAVCVVIGVLLIGRNLVGQVSSPLVFTSTSAPGAPGTSGGSAASPQALPGSSRVRSRDTMLMVYVPAGDFIMGLDADTASRICLEYRSYCSPDWFTPATPPRTVTLSAYWIDSTEVTNGMYALCVQAGTCQEPAAISSATREFYYDHPTFVDYPVINVTWENASDYCTWAGGRLPTEAEWEKAARGTDDRLYPWGDTSPDCTIANYWSQVCAIPDTRPVGSFPAGASPYGALDMGGNVWEWVNDWYDPEYYGYSPAVDPTGPAGGELRVQRGGAGRYNQDILVSSRNGLAPETALNQLGFRCVVTAP